MGRGSRLLVVWTIASWCGPACGPNPEERVNAWVRQAQDPGPDRGAGADDISFGPSDAAEQGTDEASEARFSCVNLTGSFLLVFTTEMKGEPSKDVRLDISQTGRIQDGNATLAGVAVAAASPDVTLGTIPAAPVGTDGRFRLVIEGFQIPPGQEPLLPDGGTAVVTLDAAIVDADRFCGLLDFHLLTPFDIRQSGAFGAYRIGVAEPKGPGCD